MIRWATHSSAIDLAMMRIAIAGFMILNSNLSHEIFFFAATEKVFHPIGVFAWMEQPLSLASMRFLFLAWLFACKFVLVGLFTRYLAPIWFVLSVIVLNYDSNFGVVGHGSQLILLASLILALSRCSDRLSLDALFFKQKETNPERYFYPLMGMRLLVVQSMLTVGLQKFFHQGLSWVFSDNLYIQIFNNPLKTPLAYWILDQPLWVSQSLAFYTMFIVELFAPLALLRPFCFIYPIIWASLHVGIHLTFGGFRPFFSQIPVYLCFYSYTSFLNFALTKARIPTRR